MLTVADRGEGGDKICQNLADVICERSHMDILGIVKFSSISSIYLY